MGKKKSKKHKSKDFDDDFEDEREVGEKESMKIVLKVGGGDAGSDVSYSHDEKKHKHKKKKKKKDKDRHRHAENDSVKGEEDDDYSVSQGEDEEVYEPPSKRALLDLDEESNSSQDLHPRRSARQVTEMKEDGKGVLRECLLYIQKHLQRIDVNGFFAYPVNDVEAPGYSSIIQEPMDFSTMLTKIENDTYDSIMDYKSDYVLMCNNAMTYNRPETIYYKEAKRLLQSGLNMMSKEKLLVMRRSLGFINSITMEEIGINQEDNTGAVLAELDAKEKEYEITVKNRDNIGRFEAFPDNMTPDEIPIEYSGTRNLPLIFPGFTMAQRRKNLDNSTNGTPAKIQRNSCQSGTPTNQFTNRGSALKGNTPRCAAKGKAPLKFSLPSASNHVSGNAIENVGHNNQLNLDNGRTGYQYETSHSNLKATENSISNIFQNQFNEMEFDVKPSKQDLDNIMNEMDEILKEPCISDEHQIEQKVFREMSCQTDTELSINTEEHDANLQRLTHLEHHQAMKLKNYKESFETMKSCMLTESRELAETKKELDRLKSELLKESTNHKETKHTIEMLQREKLEAKKQLDEREDKLTNCQTELKNLSEEYKKMKHSLEILTQARIMEQKQLDAAKEALENSTEKLNKQITEHKETQCSLDTLKRVSSIDKKQLEETKKELEKLKVEKSKETRELNNRIQLEKSDRSRDLERLHQIDLERLHQLEKELSEERNEHTETKQILERTYNEKVSLNQECFEKKNALDKLNEEKTKEKQELLDTKSSVERMSKEKQHLIDTGNSVIESLKAENRKLMEKLEETKNSVKDERVNRSRGSEETVDHLKSQFLQRGHELQEQKTALEEQKTANKRLKLNILTLMKLIVPDFEFGDPENIENVILEFIAANNEHSGSGDCHSCQTESY